MVTVIIMFIIGSFIASTLVIAASMLSSRVNNAQPMVEEYEAKASSKSSAKGFTPRTYPVEI